MSNIHVRCTGVCLNVSGTSLVQQRNSKTTKFDRKPQKPETSHFEQKQDRAPAFANGRHDDHARRAGARTERGGDASP